MSEVALGSYLTYGAGLADTSGMGCLRRAFELGVNLFDTADTYGHGRAEELLGAAARELGRHDLVLATKCFFPMSDDPNDRGLSRKHLFDSVHASLRRLGTDYIDLFQCHRLDPETPLEETVGALADLVRQGEILYWGVSRWSGEQVRASVEAARARVALAPISNQYPYHALYREMEGETLEACAASGVGMIAHSPLAQGVLSGKYAGGAPPGSRGAQADLAPQMYQLTPADVRRADRLARIAGEAGLRPASSPSHGRCDCPASRALWWAPLGSIRWRRTWRRAA